MKARKRVSTAIWHYFRPELVGFICANRHFFFWFSSAEIFMGRRRNLDGGTLNFNGGMLTLDGGTHPPTIYVLPFLKLWHFVSAIIENLLSENELKFYF